MEKQKVYFAKAGELEKIIELIPELKAPLGVKVHFGEDGNVTHIPAELIKPIVSRLKNPTFIETSVLYKSPRRTAKGHREVALNHGFDFAPIDFLDGEAGDDVLEIPVKSQHFKTVFLGKGLKKYAALLVVSHFKGHSPMAGFGGAIKNLGMGLAARRGKLAQHASIQHEVDANKCVSCGTCINDCPVNAIAFGTDNKASINHKICIGCSKCISVCPTEAIGIPWESTSPQVFQERLVEYAKAGAEGKQCFYINFLINITEGCDCQGKKMKVITPDIGVLAGNDPVALDSACFDLVTKQHPEFKIRRNGEFQLAHGKKIGFGTRQYELIEL